MKKVIKAFLFIGTLGALIAGYIGLKIYGSNTIHESEKLIYISSGADHEEVMNTLDTSGIIDDISSFRWVSGLMKYSDRVKSGRYIIPPELSNKDLVSLLRSGNQSPVNLTISHGRTLQDVASIISHQMEVDSVGIVEALTDNDFLSEVGLTSANVLSLVIPNTYQIYWDESAAGIATRLKKEYDKYWQGRQVLLEEVGLSQLEVSTLASIVESESQQQSERPTIAGVYLNRLRDNIPLQADPTVVFAVGDFTIRRVLNKHLEIDSPYNTYKNTGLPPGPICMPSISSLNAVLSPDKHDYLFFCAKPGYNAGHNFAKSNSEHERNARLYHRWLSREGIKG